MENTVLNITELTELQERRLHKYIDKIDKHPKLMNQIRISGEGKGMLMVNGVGEECTVTGYIMLPGSKWIERIEDKNILICNLPKDKLIINCDNQYIFRGYKKDNTPGFMLFLLAKGNFNVCLVCDIDDEKNLVFMLDEVYEEDIESSCECLFNQFEKFMKNDSNLVFKEVEATYEEDEEDSWE